MFDGLAIADGAVLRVARTDPLRGEAQAVHAFGHTQAAAPFFDDYRALAFEVFALVVDGECLGCQGVEGEFELRLAAWRAEQILGAIVIGHGVEVATLLKTCCLQACAHIFGMLAMAVEGEVLDHVSDADLLVAFVHRAGVDGQA